jgi:hypothetical protein
MVLRACSTGPLRPSGEGQSLPSAAAERVGESVACFVESFWAERRDASAKRRSLKGVEAVERNHAVLFEPVTEGESQLRREPL